MRVRCALITLFSSLCLLCRAVPATAQVTFETLKSFVNDTGDGAYPEGPMVRAEDGWIYGLSSGNRTTVCSSLFRFNPTDPAGTFQTVWPPAGTLAGCRINDGGLVKAGDGNLYFVSLSGGVCNAGLIWQVTPPDIVTPVFDFGCPPSAAGPALVTPGVGLTVGADGAIYGITDYGGAHVDAFGFGFGGVYRLGLDGTFSTVASFSGPHRGQRDPLVAGSDGRLYGTAANIFDVSYMYRVDPTSSTVETLYEFPVDASNGYFPRGRLLEVPPLPGQDIAMVGVTQSGGTLVSGGVVYRVDVIGSSPTFTKLHEFTVSGPYLGENPVTGLIRDSDGTLYGTTYGYGFPNPAGGLGPGVPASGEVGTIYRIGADGVVSKLYSDAFIAPYAPLLLASDGNLYGTSYINTGAPFPSASFGSLFKLSKADQAPLNVTGSPDSAIYGTSFAVSYTGGSGTGAITFTTSGACGNIAGGTLITMTSGTGSCAITVAKAGDVDFKPAISPPVLVTAVKAAQTMLTVTDAPASAAFGAVFPVTVSGGSGIGAVVLSATGVCSVAGGFTIAMTSGAGMCAISATKASDANYEATVSATVLVTATPQASTVVIDFEDQPDQFTLAAFPNLYRDVTWNDWRHYAPYEPNGYDPDGANAIFAAVDGASFTFSERVFVGAAFSAPFLQTPPFVSRVFFELFDRGVLVHTSADLDSPSLTFLASGYSGLVDEVRVRTIGPLMTLGGSAWVMDDVTFQAAATPIVNTLARNGVVTTSERSPVSGMLPAITSGGGVLSFSIAVPPAHGVVAITDTATGAFIYTPDADAIGYDPFTFAVSDGTNSSVGTEMVFVVANSARWPGQTVRASAAIGGSDANSVSTEPSMSADGRFVAFASLASNLVAGDTNGSNDVFVLDRQSRQITRVSVASAGLQSNGHSSRPSISADGRFVAFWSSATNLVEGDTNGALDVFVHDRQTSRTTRVSVASDGTQANADSAPPRLSADGRFVAFSSSASNLVPGDTNGVDDVFVHDLQTGETTRVSVASDGSQANAFSVEPAISADGRIVAFRGVASNLVPGDTNDADDVFVHDLQTGETTRVSIASGREQSNGTSLGPALSADGRIVAFHSSASNLVATDTSVNYDMFVHDRQTGQTTRVSVSTGGAEANADSAWASLSADGRFVAFLSSASNLVADDTNGVEDVFVHDRQAGETTRVSVAGDGAQGNGDTEPPAVSADGRFAAFASIASNLVATDTNDTDDVFLVGGVTVSPRSASFGAAGGTATTDVAFVYPGTEWRASSPLPWITVTNQGSTAGNGTVTYSVTANTEGSTRTGALIAAAQRVAIFQDRATIPTASDGAFSTNEDTAVSGFLSATDPNGDSLTFTIVSNGALGSVVVTNASTGAFSYTPNANANGTDTFTFKASDGTSDSNVATITVAIAAVNDAPVAFASRLITNEDTAATGLLTATDIDNPSLTYVVVTPPTKGSLLLTNAATGAYVYTPNANANSADAFTFKANDGAIDSNVATVTVTITPVNDPPVANSDDTQSTLEDTPLGGTLTAIDVDGDSLAYAIVANGTKGAVTITNPATGAFTYTPNANANGMDSFTFKVNDGTVDSNVATVTVTIIPVNDAPVALDGAASVIAGASTSATLVATDIDSSTLTRAIVQNGTKGVATITNATTGAFTYTANVGASGTDTFTFKANDGQLDSNVAILTVTIQPATCTPATNVTSQLRINVDAARKNRTTGAFTQRVRIRNTSGAAIVGPISYVLDGLTAGTTVGGGSGFTTCALPSASPFITLNVGADRVLSAGERVEFVLDLVNDTATAVTHTPRVLAGTGTR